MTSTGLQCVHSSVSNALKQTGINSLDDAVRWGRKGGWALLDQALFSGTNFLASILLARWMSPGEFGAYAVGFSALLIASGIYNALVLEPASVLGPSLYAKQLEEYTRFYWRFHFRITVPIGLVLSAAGGLYYLFSLGSSRIALALLGAGLTLPAVLYMWWARRACYVHRVPDRAAVVSLWYGLVAVGGLLGIHHAVGMDVLSAFAWIGIASWVVPRIIVHESVQERASDDSINPQSVFKENWSFGKWILLGTLLSVGAGQVQTFFVAAIVGLEGAAVFRAMLNFILPMALAITAIATLALSSLSGDYGRKDFPSLRRKGRLISAALTFAAGCFWLVIYFFGSQIEHVLYGGRYAEGIQIASVLGAIPLFTAMGTGFSLILRSMQKPGLYFVSSLSSALVGIPTGWWFTAAWGVHGAAWSMALTYLMGAIVAGTLYVRIAIREVNVRVSQ